MPPIPEIAEPLDALRARYPQALAHVYDTDAIRDHGAIRPGECAGNVFDFEDGLRLIISRERIDAGVVLHISASLQAKTRLADKLRRSGGTAARLQIEFMRAAEKRFRELSGNEQALDFVFWTQGMIPHWQQKER